MTYFPTFLVSVSRFDLEQLNRQFNLASPNRILAWCVENIFTGLVQASAFDGDDMIIDGRAGRWRGWTKMECDPQF